MKLTVNGEKTTTLYYKTSVTLADACRDAGEVISAACGGDGKCGKCRVYVTSGLTSEPTDTERRLLGDEAIRSGERLACTTRALGDMTLSVRKQNAVINTVTAPSGAEPDTCADGNVCVAVDIGTTTVAAKLVGKNGIIAESASLNPQVSYGADVISRISYADQNGVDALRDAITSCVFGLIRKLNAPDGCSRVVVGNTVMLHLYKGIDPSTIGRAPFTPPSLFGCEADGEYLGACVSGYVGADVIAAVLASGMTKSKERSLLCDIGTNGEIVYWDGEHLYAVSAAAGPAFEGAGISSGMVAAEGAVDRVTVTDEALSVHVIGDGLPRGICGGGLIDAVAALYRLGVIDEGGYMEELYDLGGICLTPADVRAFQLAKGAIRAAIDVAFGDAEPDTVYVSGGFASGLDVESAIVTGLFPKHFRGKVRFIGNGALSGAVMMATSEEARREAERLASETVYDELSTSPEFAQKFIEELSFPDLSE